MKLHQNHKETREGRNELRRANMMSYSNNVNNKNISEEENKDKIIINEEEEAGELEKDWSNMVEEDGIALKTEERDGSLYYVEDDGEDDDDKLWWMQDY